MVCPYCSTDMEPIELGGKTFCSNCGLTVGAANSQARVMINTDIARPTTPVTPVPTDRPTAPLLPQTPIKDGMKSDLGLPVNEADDLIIAKVDQAEPVVADIAEPQQPVKLSVGTGDDPALDQKGFYTAAPAEAETTKETIGVPEAPKPIQDLEEIPPLGQTIDIPTENDFEAPAEDVQSTRSLDEKVKEVDTLGASGILLDILNENYQAADREDEVKALEAAEELMDEIHDPVKAEVHAGVLLDKPANPIENPEIASPLDTIEIAAPEITEPTNSIKPEPEVSDEPEPEDEKEVATTVSNEETEKSNTPDKPADELYTLPHELGSTAATHPDESSSAEIEAAEKKLATLEDPEVGPEVTNSKDFDPDAVAPLAKEVVANYHPTVSATEPQTPADTKEDEPETPASGVKQEVIKSFFKDKIEGPKKRKKSGLLNSIFKKSPKSRKKAVQTPVPQKIREKGQKKKLSLWLLVGLAIAGGLFVILTITFSLVYFYKPSAQQSRTQQAAEVSNFDSIIPATLPPGYEMSSSNYNEGKKKLTVKFTFVNDKDKSITYSQTQQKDSANALAEYIKSNDKATYVSREQDGVSFTELSTGALAWTKDDFLFTIETVKYDFASDLLYKMALSLG